MISFSPHEIQLLAIAALIPFAAYIVSRIHPSWLISLGLAAEVFSGHWLTMGIQLPLDRLLLLGGFFSIAVNKDMRSRVRGQISLVAALFAVIGIYTVISGVTQGSIVVGGHGFWMLFDRLGFFPFAAFITAPVVFAMPSDREVFLKVFTCLGAYLSITAIFEVIGPKALVYPRYIMDQNLASHLGRARGPFVEAVPNGMAMFSCGVVSLLASKTLKDARWREFAICVVPVAGVGMFLSLTRSVWVGSAAAVVIAIAFAPSIRKQLLIGTAGMTAILLVVFLSVPGLSETATGRAEEQGPIWDRINTNNAAISMVHAHPLFGVGWNTFQNKSSEYLHQSGDTPLTGENLEVHNMLFSIFAELGLVGGTMWLAAFAWSVGSAVFANWSTKRRTMGVALLAVLCSWLGVATLSPLDQGFPNLFIWTFAGLALATARENSDELNDVDLREVVNV